MRFLRLMILTVLCACAAVGRTSALSFQQSAKLAADDAEAWAYLGSSVALDWNTALVGAPQAELNDQTSGAAYLFSRSADGTWTQWQKLQPADGGILDYFGISVAVRGAHAIVGAPLRSDGVRHEGAAYVFRNVGGTWTLVQKLQPGELVENDRFGDAVAMDGSLAAIGAGYGNTVYVYRNAGGTWTEAARLEPEAPYDTHFFGAALDMEDCTIIVGSRFEDVSGVRCGGAYIYRDDGQGWEQVAHLLPSDYEAGQQFGTSVSVSGDFAFVGAVYDDGAASTAGAVYWYYQSDGSWHEGGKITAPDARRGQWFGNAVSVDDDIALIGAYNDNDVVPGAGAVYVYRHEASGWTLLDKLTATDANR